MGTADELYELLDDFEAWANKQIQTVKKIAKRFIHKVRSDVEERERERGKKEPKGGGKDGGGASEGELEGSTAPAGAVTEPRPKGPGRVVWTSPPGFPYQTTPSKGYEGRPHVTGHKHEVYGIETQLNHVLSTGYKHVGSGGGWEVHLHADLKEPLERFRAALRDVYGYDVDLPFDSCYRPLGTDVPPEETEDGEGDEGGKRDARDDKGHWTGESVDLHTKYVRGYFGIPDGMKNDPNFLDKIGEVVGLRRPYLNDLKDGVHWTYCESTRKKFPAIIIDGETYGGDEPNP
jgi:hypothetical protein